MKTNACWLVVLAVCAAVRADTFESEEVKLCFTDRGEGEPVVLIHGLGGNARTNWELPGVIDLLAKDYRVIALDCRGHGGSDKPEGEAAYGVKMVEDVVRLLDHLEIEKAHLVGYSMGGMIVMKLLVTHPDRVRSAILGGMGWLKAGGAMEKVWERMPDRGMMAPEGCTRSLAEMAVTEEEVRRVELPVAIVVGDRDPVRRLYVDPLQKARPDWEVKVIEGAGHLSCIAKEEFRTAVKTLLDRQASGGR